MPEFDLPAGQYFSVSGLIAASTGGKTRALLMRNRLFATRCGVSPIIITFDRKPHYPEVRRVLTERRELVEPMQLLNIFEYHRDADLDSRPVLGGELPPIEGYVTEDTPHPDGSTYITHWIHPRTDKEIVVDYRRPDGSVYLRMPGYGASKTQRPTDVFLLNSQGGVVGRWDQPMGFRHNWLRELTPAGQRRFLISDSQTAVNWIIPWHDPDTYVLYVMHNTHNAGDWHPPIYGAYKTALGQVENLDGLVNLTERQTADVAQKLGARTNLFSIGNPVELPDLPDTPEHRDPKRFVMVCRLEPQKAVDKAIRVFARVLATEPDAKLDIYGDGGLHIALQRQINELGVQDSIVLKGHDPAARESLRHAAGFVVTSVNEGFPLATLESLSYGCPVIAYDVKYGIREQIKDDRNGYVIALDDEQAMADRIVAMARDEALVERLSAGALESAQDHDHRGFLRNWQRVLNTVVEQKPRRTTLDSVRLSVREFGPSDASLSSVYVNAERALRRADKLELPGRVGAAVSRYAKRADAKRRAQGAARSSSFAESPTLSFAGTLTVEGHSEKSTLDDAVITLKAVAHNATAVAPVPLTIRRKGENTFDLSAEFDPATVFAQMGTAANVRLRLRVVWENSSWETFVKRPSSGRAPYELSFERGGEAVLWRRPPT